MEPNYQKDISIDRFNLEKECEKHSEIYFQYGELHAKAVNAKDEAKRHYDLVLTDTELDIRSNWGNYSDIKMTESAVSAVTQKQNIVKIAYQDYMKAMEEVRLLEVAKTALEHRRKMLEHLVNLYIHNYYSNPKVEKEAREVLAPAQRQERHEDVLQEESHRARFEKKTLLIRKKGD